MATRKTTAKTTTTNKAAKAAATDEAAKSAEAEKAEATEAAKTPAAAKTTAAKTTKTTTTAKTTKAAATKTTSSKAAPAAEEEPKAAPAAKAATSKATAAKATVSKATAAKSAATKSAATKTTKAAAAKAAEEPKAEAKAAPAAKPAAAKTTKAAAAKASAKAAEEPKVEEKAEVKAAEPAKPAAAKTAKPAAKPSAAKTSKAAAAKAEEPKAEAKDEPKAEPKAEEPAKEAAAAKATKAAASKTTKKAKVAAPMAEEPKPEPEPEPVVEAAPEPEPEPVIEAAPEPEPEPERYLPEPRRSVAFIGSECYPFVKTGGLGDVMYALPKALIDQNCDVKVIVPNYGCIKPEYKEKMVFRGSFYMDLTADGRQFYVGIMEYVWDGVVYDFIDNEEFFTRGNPYTNLVDDIPVYSFFSKAALSALLYMDWIPDVIHCHDWQAALVPIYLRTMFKDTALAHSKSVITIHNLRFQGQYNIPTIKYWTNLPGEVFNMGALQENWTEANLLKGGVAYADAITTVSNTYAAEIQTPEFGEGMQQHLGFHSYKLRGIVNGIDTDIWNPATDTLLEAPYNTENAIEQKKANKMALQRSLGLQEDPDKFVVGLISRLTSQKGLDLVTTVLPGLIDGFTQVVILGTGEPDYENAFRYYENEYKGTVCSYIAYDEALSHQIYAGADVLLVPSQFEPCGLTQLIAMRYGTVPVVRETGGLKDTVEPYNMFENTGNGYTFDRYDAGLLADAINRAKTLYFEDRPDWDRMVIRDMEKDVSWARSAEQYRWLYLDLTM